jgi:predicted  nucleic acid-binding Zn-ribbon protein
VASVAEVKAAMGAAKAQVVEVQAILHEVNERLDQAAQSIAAAIDGSGHEAAHSALAFNTQAKQDCEELIQRLQAEIEQLDAYAGGL